jgi:hypothetical protein
MLDLSTSAVTLHAPLDVVLICCRRIPAHIITQRTALPQQLKEGNGMYGTHAHKVLRILPGLTGNTCSREVALSCTP